MRIAGRSTVACPQPIRIALLVGLLPPLCLVMGAEAAVGDEFTGKTMGPVTYHVKVSKLPEDQSADQVARLIQAALDDVNDRMSTYQADSEVSRFNASESTDWFDVSARTAEVVQRSLELSEATDGAFDITVMPLVNLWNFGPQPSADELPSEDQLEAALASVGYHHLQVRLEPPALRKQVSSLSIDLSAIAKGYAVDRVVAELKHIGARDFMVEVGGEVFAEGVNERDDAWLIGIESPDLGARQTAHRVNLVDAGLATSGDYRNFVVIDGVTYSHTIDPRTGKPVAHSLASASIIADDCMTADALATAMMVVGPREAEQLAKDLKVEALWITRDGAELVTAATTKFPLFEPEPDAGGGSSLMTVIGAALIVFAVALIGMSVGVIFSNRTIKGSCGGLAALKKGDTRSPCEICESRSTCEDYRKASTSQSVEA